MRRPHHLPTGIFLPESSYRNLPTGIGSNRRTVRSHQAAKCVPSARWPMFLAVLLPCDPLAKASLRREIEDKRRGAATSIAGDRLARLGRAVRPMAATRKLHAGLGR